jgi:hypothetical protein
MRKFKRQLSYFAFTALWGLGTVSATSQDRYYLKNEDIQSLRLKLPTSLPDLQELSKYQRRITTHQQLVIQWDSMNGQHAIVSKQEADAYGNARGIFTLLKQSKAKPLSPSSFDTELYDKILVVGRTNSKEIRCLATMHDPREGHAEFFDKKNPERYDFVNPLVTFDLEFCDDPAITVLDFFQLDHRSKGKMFKTLGSLAVSR